MKKILKWVLIFIVIIVAIPFLLFILLLLCFPISYKIYAKIDEKKDVCIKVSYLFGFVRYMYSYKYHNQNVCETDESLRLLFFQLKPKANKQPGRKIKFIRKRKTSEMLSFLLKNEKKTSKENIKDETNFLAYLKQILTYDDFKTIIKDSSKTIKKLLLAIRPKFIKIVGEFGLECPADTAFLYGGYEAAAHILSIRKNVTLQPVFDNQNVLRLDADVKGRVNIYKLIFPVVGFLLSKPIISQILKGESDE